MSEEDIKLQNPQDEQAQGEGGEPKPTRPKVVFRDVSVPAEPSRTSPPAEPSRTRQAEASNGTPLPQPPSYAASEPSRGKPAEPAKEPAAAPVEPRMAAPEPAAKEPSPAIPLSDPVAATPAEPRRAAPAPVPEPEPVQDDKIEIPKPASKHDAIGAIKAMLSFYTILPIKTEKRDYESMDSNFYFSPFIGFIIGGLAALLVFVFALVFNRMESGILMAAIALAVPLVFSRFLHFDGLADFGDGMVCAGDKDKRLFALKDSTIGAGGFGVAFIVTLFTFASLAGLSTMWVMWVALLIWPLEVLTKNAMVAAAAFGKPGNGMAGGQVRCTTRNTLLLSTMISAVLAFVTMGIAVGLLALAGMSFSGQGLMRYAAALVVMIVVSVLIGFVMAGYSNDKFGMVNGDILGATNEISRAAMLFLALIPLAV
jgi:adenosylcobinamide-GDP ribazoletransferase